MRSSMLTAPIAILLFLLLSAGDAGAQEVQGGSYTKIPTVKGIEILKAGSKAPDFSVKDLAGNELSLRDFLDKDAVLLFFWSYFCGPCREEFPLINEMAREYGGKGLQVIGVDLDGREMKKVIDRMVDDEKVSFRIVFDELDDDAFRIADPYGVSGTPALFIIDRKGIITFGTVGVVTVDDLRREIAKVAK